MTKTRSLKKKRIVSDEPLKLDLGCGPNPKEGFIGVDAHAFPGVSVILDLRKKWPWKNESVSEINCSHVIEHFDSEERCHIVNEMFRVLKPEGQVTLVTPHWASCRAYGDPTHKWAPVSEMWFYYLDKVWRMANAPHTDISVWPKGFNCDFGATWGYSMHPDLNVRNVETQNFAMQNYKEAIQDCIATLTKKPNGK